MAPPLQYCLGILTQYWLGWIVMLDFWFDRILMRECSRWIIYSHLTWLAEHIGFCDERTMVTNSSSWLQRWWYVFVRAMIIAHSYKPPCHRRSLLHQNQTFLVWLVESLSGLWSRSGGRIVLSPEIFCFPGCVSKYLVKELTICCWYLITIFPLTMWWIFMGWKHCIMRQFYCLVKFLVLPSLTTLPPPALRTGPPASFWAALCLWMNMICESFINSFFWWFLSLQTCWLAQQTVNWQSFKTGVVDWHTGASWLFCRLCLATDKCNSLQKVCPIFPQSARPLLLLIGWGSSTNIQDFDPEAVTSSYTPPRSNKLDFDV